MNIITNHEDAVRDLHQFGQAKPQPEKAVQIFDDVVKHNTDFLYLVLIRDKRHNEYFIETQPPLIRLFEEVIKEMEGENV